MLQFRGTRTARPRETAVASGVGSPDSVDAMRRQFGPMRSVVGCSAPHPRLLARVVVVLGLLLACLLAGALVAARVAAAASRTIRIGSADLVPCQTGPAVFCGNVRVPLDWARPSVSPQIGVHFAFQPATNGHAIGTVVAVEGGPGYPSTGSLSDYQAMYGTVLRTHNLLLVDNRGTGDSTPIDCPGLQAISVDATAAAFAKARRSLRALAQSQMALPHRRLGPGVSPVLNCPRR